MPMYIIVQTIKIMGFIFTSKIVSDEASDAYFGIKPII
jgi:hypothetical protein